MKVWMFVALILIYFKPYYGFLLLPLFGLEFLYLLDFLYVFYFEKYISKKYCVIKIDKFYTGSSTLKLWSNICKIKAFSRFYRILLAKKFSVKSILITIFIIIFNIPLKLIILIKDLLKLKGSLNSRLKFYYDFLYDENKNLKIEILNNKYYLNCIPTLKGIISTLKVIYPHLNKKEMIDLTKLLQHQNKGYVKFEKSQPSRVMTYMSKIETSDGVKIPFTHPSYEWNVKLNNYRINDGNLSLHATSNIKIEANPTQIIGSPINDLIKKNSVNPGTVITKNPRLVKYGEFKNISIYELEAILFEEKENIEEKFGWELKIDNGEYLQTKNDDWTSTLNSYKPIKSIKTLISPLMLNNWDIPLSNATNEEISSVVESLIG